MSVFKVGQRVKKVADCHPVDYARAIYLWRESVGPSKEIEPSSPCGSEGVIVGPWALDASVYDVDFGRPFGVRACHHYMLAPLTDPKAEQFMESIKRLTYEEPKVVRVTQEEKQ